jgi:RNA polymerase sigma-70 factor (ECF subfamily)
MSMSPSDIEISLIEACRRGERAAQFRLYNRYSKAMLNTAHRILNDEEAAKDALQEAFIKVFRNIGSFRAQSTLGAWIKRIVVNTAINQHKKRGLTFEIFDEQTPELPALPDNARDREHIEMHAGIARKALSELPPGYRTVLTLYLVEGYDHSEIAEILGISISTSLSQYNRGKKRLRTTLEQLNAHGAIRKILP